MGSCVGLSQTAKRGNLGESAAAAGLCEDWQGARGLGAHTVAMCGGTSECTYNMRKLLDNSTASSLTDSGIVKANSDQYDKDILLKAEENVLERLVAEANQTAHNIAALKMQIPGGGVPVLCCTSSQTASTHLFVKHRISPGA